MNLVNGVLAVVDGICTAAVELPVLTYAALKNTAQGCVENPTAIPVLVTALAMANGGAAATYKCGRIAVDSFKGREFAKGSLYTVGTALAGTISLAGGISAVDLIMSPASGWRRQGFKVIGDSTQKIYDATVYLFENVLELPKWGFEAGKFVVQQSLKNPAAACTCTFTAAVTAMSAVASYRLGQQGIQEFKAGMYAKSGKHFALAGVATVAAAVSATSTSRFYDELRWS